MRTRKSPTKEDKSDIQDLIRLHHQEKYARLFREYLRDRKKKQGEQIVHLKHRKEAYR